MLKFLVGLLFLSLVTCTQVTSYFDYNAQEERVTYSILLSVGIPHNRFELTVDFDSDKLVIFKRLDQISITYSTDRGGSDVVSFGDEQRRVPITMDPNKELDVSAKACGSCEGIIGMSQTSFFWRIWSSASFTQDTIILDAFHNLFILKKDKCNSCIASCVPSIHGGLCEMEVLLNGLPYKAILSASTFTYLPQDFYFNYTLGNNIYDGDIEKWTPLNITIPSIAPVSAELRGYFTGKGADITRCYPSIEIKLHGDDLVIDSDKSHKKLLLRSHNLTDTIILGLTTWSHLLMHYDFPRDFVVLKSHDRFYHHSIFNLIVILVLFRMLGRWEAQTVSITNKQDAKMAALFDSVNELIPIPLILAVYGMKSTFYIMHDYKAFYIVTGVVLSIQAIMILTVITYTLNRANTSPLTGFRYEFVKKSLNCLFLSTGLWLALVEKRSDSLGNLLTFAIQGVICYFLFYYFVTGIVWAFYTKLFTKTKPFSIYCFLFIPLMMIYYISTSLIYFVLPVSRYYASQVIEEFYIAFTLIFYVAIMVLAIYVVNRDLAFVLQEKTELKKE
jgi:hypothetical protein